MSLKTLDNYNVRSKIPIDSRMVVNNITEIELPYEGLIVYCKDDSKRYEYINGTFQEYNKNINDKIKDIVNIREYGALCNGNDETAIIQNALNDMYNKGNKNILFIPYGTSYVFSNLSIPQGLRIEDESGSIFKKRVFDMNAQNQTSTLCIQRKNSQTGGTIGGFTTDVLRIINEVTTDNENYQWGITSVLYNSSKKGQNVAIYGQANHNVDGGSSWAGCFEARDNSNGVTSTLVGIEVDVVANGADTINRVGVDVVSAKLNSNGADMTAYAGVRVVNNEGGTSTKFTNGYIASGNVDNAFRANSNGKYGFKCDGNYLVGLDFTSATISQHAIRLKSGQDIALEETGSIMIKYNGTNGHIEFYNGQTLIGHITAIGGVDHEL